MTPAFLTGLDMLRQMQALTGCCDTQPPVVVYRDRPALSQPAAAAPVGGGYAAWSAFHAGHISEWLTLDQLRAECGRLASVGAPSPELLLSHAMRLLDAPAAAVPDGWVQTVEQARDALLTLLARDMGNTCQHENTHRGGAIWEICDDCGAQWADDRNPKPKWKDPKEWPAAEQAIDALAAMLAAAPQAPQQADRAMQALRVAREALALPCDRWNATQSRIVREALATVDAVLRDAPPATPAA